MSRSSTLLPYSFTTFSAVAVVIGVVVGVGIFRLPPIVAQHAGGELQFMLFWLAGGIVSLLGALCYAELASNRPDAGGEYHFLTHGFGPVTGFLFAWARMTVIQTGSIALVAFIFGDYANRLLDLGGHGTGLYAALTVIGLTALNLLGTRHSSRVQSLLSGLIVLLLLLLPVAALFAGAPAAGTLPADAEVKPGAGTMGLAMIFVLLTFGGWNEAAYLSAELHDVRRNMTRVLLLAIVIITALYLIVNFAYLQVFGLHTLRGMDTVTADLGTRLFGDTGGVVVSLIVILAALSTANATIITGARTNYALGRDFSRLRLLGRWNANRNTPANALLVQAVIALALIALGLWLEQAIRTVVDYAAPIFWLFMLLTVLTLFVFRHRQLMAADGYRVPLFPLTPVLFLLACLYMLYSSLAFTGMGAMLGVAVLIAGVPVYLWCRHSI